MMVGWMKYPGFRTSAFPPAATVHFSFSISAKNSLIFSYCIEFWMGPTITPASLPSPTTNFAVATLIASRNFS
ncbi:hypothetical protein I7I53_02823 [Histoplasma capsulatum var. duboisii H88]|uniref:Uncharacterized protein n=1 Tax=Ajellomyces capsulatus (strain H88) TaxID=544711 RepID=A0A8A1LM90_AJEC8|nr:hypothetical protein I7I53_02823 [Histoplasma capsulatum var. duboisii H88]